MGYCRIGYFATCRFSYVSNWNMIIMVSDKELKEALDIIDEMLEGNEREKQKGSAHAFRKFPYGMGHEQYNLLKKMVKILTS